MAPRVRAARRRTRSPFRVSFVPLPGCARGHATRPNPPVRLGRMADMGQAGRMKPFPLPLRVAAGLAVSTAERVRELPRQLAGLPVTVVSQVLQASMRVQQHVTELAIKGDNALSSLRPVEDTPSWATFDEDVDVTPARSAPAPVADVPEPRSEINGHIPSAAELEAEL